MSLARSLDYPNSVLTIRYAAEYQGADGIDAVFGFGMMNGFTKCFTGSSPSSLQTLSNYIDKAKSYPVSVGCPVHPNTAHEVLSCIRVLNVGPISDRSIP